MARFPEVGPDMFRGTYAAGEESRIGGVQRNWIELDGLVNLRDVGGIPTTDGGTIAPGRLLRSDNLQSLTAADIEALLALGLSDVVDLRSEYEVEMTGPGPLIGHERVAIHQHSFFKEWREEATAESLTADALPWVGMETPAVVEDPIANHYFSYLTDRPDSVLAALRVIAGSPGATLVHCAAGKDRTGTTVALALSLVGAERASVIDDYAASSDRVEAIVDRLLAEPTYADNLRGRPIDSHLSHPATMASFLTHVDDAYGGVEPMLNQMGWTTADTNRLYAKLRG